MLVEKHFLREIECSLCSNKKVVVIVVVAFLDFSFIGVHHKMCEDTQYEKSETNQKDWKLENEGSNKIEAEKLIMHL